MVRERLGSPRARLFVALELPRKVVEDAAGWAREAFGPAEELRLVRPESLHVTLVFLGYHPEREIERIAEVSFGDGGEGGAFDLTPEGVVPVPRSRPRLLALALEDAGGALGAWQDGLSRRLETAGLYEPEKRPFWAHVTLARVKRGARVRRGLELPGLPAELEGPFLATRVTLFRSTLKPSGAVYDALASVELG
ncbi:MAG: RNA 2',3'-cyclic phosphodiesterase [Solirubrobacterales bacterium]